MSSTPTLSIDPRRWTETIESAGPECLSSEVSAKNVNHVLSTATVRAPQKQLCAAISQHVSSMLDNKHGISILTALVQYGTTTTVNELAAKLIAANRGLWTFVTAPKKEVVKSLSHLLDRLVYREDCTGESYVELLRYLKVAKRQSLLSSSFTLPATARLALVDKEFAASLMASGEAQKAFAESCQDSARAIAAEEFCRIFSEKTVDGIEDFLWKALAPSLKATAKKRPCETMLVALAALAPVPFSNRMADTMAQWPTLHDLCKRETYMTLVAHLLERCDDEKVGSKLVAAVMLEEADVTERMTARTSAPQRLLAAINTKPIYAQTLEKRLGSSQTKRLAAAKARFVTATQPKAIATHQAISDKLQKLRSTSGAGAKRARD